MTATELPNTRDGPFVVFVPEGSALPGLHAWLAMLGALGGIILRNIFLYVALPGTTLVGGLVAIRRLVDSTERRNTTLWGNLVVASGLVLAAGAIITEGTALPFVTGNLLAGGALGIAYAAVGFVTTRKQFRDTVTVGHLVGGGLLATVAVVAVATVFPGMERFFVALTACVGLFPVVAALGRADADRDDQMARRLLAGLAVVVFVGLGVLVPLTALGGTLFIILSGLLTLAALGIVLASVPLYVLGAASVSSSSG